MRSSALRRTKHNLRTWWKNSRCACKEFQIILKYHVRIDLEVSAHTQAVHSPLAVAHLHVRRKHNRYDNQNRLPYKLGPKSWMLASVKPFLPTQDQSLTRCQGKIVFHQHIISEGVM